MIEPQIRQLTPADYDSLIRLWQKSGLPFRPKGRDAKESIAVEMNRKDTCFLGMFDDDKLIGAVVSTSDGRKGWINRLAIDPDYRKRGLALKLIEGSEKFLYGLGLKIIAALIEDYNEPSMALFGKAGYKFSKDVYYFSKRLSDDV
jgi:ribosomal protein S18 acetylase RimI-like enzyme